MTIADLLSNRPMYEHTYTFMCMCVCVHVLVSWIREDGTEEGLED